MNLKCAIITISDTRDMSTDVSGRLIKRLLEESNHKIIDYSIVKDNKELISKKIASIIEREEVDVVITNGGTGIAKKDVTIEAIKPFFKKELHSFNALFSYLSYKEIGPGAFLSRVIAGTYNSKVIFCLPGSPRAVELAMNKLILPEISHIFQHLRE